MMNSGLERVEAWVGWGWEWGMGGDLVDDGAADEGRMGLAEGGCGLGWSGGGVEPLR